MEFTDYYETLGVSRTASEEDIQKAYRKLARQFHPDVNKSDGAEDRFKEVGEAYEVLKDPEKRAKYDQYGAAWKQMEQNSGGFPGFDFNGVGPAGFDSFFDILEHMFGQGGNGKFTGGFRAYGGSPFTSGSRVNIPIRGADYEASIRLMLEEAAAGGTRMLTIPTPDGQERRLRVNIPRGVTPGQRIRLAGQGGAGDRGSGDLYLVADLVPHPQYVLSGHDLHTQLRVPAWMAALGGKTELKTLTGKVKVSVAKGTESGRQIRLKGQGYPKGEGAGDLYAEILIEVPDRLSAEQRDAFETLKSIDLETVHNGSE